ncbi:MAG: hypothetical protein ACQESF_02900 [Nanobdellota archaeon]
MGFLFIFSMLLVVIAGLLVYFKYMKQEQEGEYIWVGKGENPLKHMK